MAGIGARMLDFGRTAIVCRMRHALEHDGTAHECFLHGHTLAMLPMAGRQSSAVWTVTSDGAAALMVAEAAPRSAAGTHPRFDPQAFVPPSPFARRPIA